VPKGRKGRASGATASGGRDQGAAILAVKWAAKIAVKKLIFEMKKPIFYFPKFLCF